MELECSSFEVENRTILAVVVIVVDGMVKHWTSSMGSEDVLNSVHSRLTFGNYAKLIMKNNLRTALTRTHLHTHFHS